MSDQRNVFMSNLGLIHCPGCYGHMSVNLGDRQKLMADLIKRITGCLGRKLSNTQDYEVYDLAESLGMNAERVNEISKREMR